jgi:hypothetical protein
VSSAIGKRTKSEFELADSVVLVFDGYSHASGTKAIGIVYRTITSDFELLQRFLDLVETRSSQTGDLSLTLALSLSLSLSLSLFLLHCSFCANALSAAELIEATLAKRVEGHVGKATLVVATVTDNGSNYLKCSSNFSRDPWACVSHTCNLVFKALVDDTTEQLGADFDVLLVRC